MITNINCYKRQLFNPFQTSIFFDYQFPNFNLEYNEGKVFYNYFWCGELPDYWVRTSFIKNENDFEEIITKDLEGNLISQVLKINGIIYSERKFLNNDDFEFYFLGKKKPSILINYDNEGKILLKEYYDEEGFHSILYVYKTFVSEEKNEVTKTEFIQGVFHKKTTILIKLF